MSLFLTFLNNFQACSLQTEYSWVLLCKPNGNLFQEIIYAYSWFSYDLHVWLELYHNIVKLCVFCDMSYFLFSTKCVFFCSLIYILSLILIFMRVCSFVLIVTFVHILFLVIFISCFFFFLLFFFFCFFQGCTAAYGGSQAGGPIGATAASLHHSHSDARFEPHLQPTPQLRATPDP